MQQYEDLEEKAGHFLQSKTINTPKELDAELDKFQKMADNKTLHIVFRGLHEAKYKLYNSFQRMWFDRSLGETGTDPYLLVQNMINACLNPKHVLYKYFKQLGVVCNDWLILSFLQHYGGASPLLDFSKNYRVALYFLCKKMKLQYSDKYIDHYASVYYYKTADTAKSFRPIHKIAEEAVRANLNVDKCEVWKNELSFSAIMQRPPLAEPVIVPVYSNQTNITDNDDNVRTTFTAANINVTSQEGEFVCNMNMEQPLEEIFQRKKKKGNTEKYIHCIDIHKGLCDYIIKEYLGGSPRAAKLIYFPSERTLALNAQQQWLATLNA